MRKLHVSSLSLIAVVLSVASVAAVACSAHNPDETTSGSGGASSTMTAASVSAAGIGGGSFAGNQTVGPGAGGGCASSSIKADLLPANLLFLIDRSGSMNCNLPPITTSQGCEMSPTKMDPMQPSKWEVIKQALKDAISGLPPTASAGITYFSADDVCGVTSVPAVPTLPLTPGQVNDLKASLDGVIPLGGTPIVGGTILAYKHLHQVAILTGNKFVVLLTDGADTCNPEAFQNFFNIEMPKAISVNIRTFAIGAPGSEPARSFLSEIAFKGGTAKTATCDHGNVAPDVGDCHFDMTTSSNFGADLAAALATVSGKALTCEFDVPQGADADFNLVNVNYTPGNGAPVVNILKDDTALCDSGAEGWQYAQNNTKIVLCGNICNIVKGDPNAKIDIVLGCETMVR